MAGRGCGSAFGKITFESHLQRQGLIGEIQPLKARNRRCLCECFLKPFPTNILKNFQASPPKSSKISKPLRQKSSKISKFLHQNPQTSPNFSAKILKNPQKSKSTICHVQIIIFLCSTNHQILGLSPKFLTISPSKLAQDKETATGSGPGVRWGSTGMQGWRVSMEEPLQKWGGLSHRYPIKLWLSNPEKECG